MNWFLRLFSVACYEDGTGGEKPADPAPADPPPAPAEDDISAYLGSKDVNPDQRPLKVIDRTGMTKEDIDRLISAAGDEIFLPEEEIKKAAKADKGKPPSGDKSADPPPVSEDDKSGKPDPDVEKFFIDLGIKREEFDKLPAPLQEKVTELYERNGPDEKSVQLIASAEQKATELQAAIDSLLDDPLVAARVEEKRTGKKYVADDLPAPTKAEIKTLMDAATDPEEFAAALSEYVASKAEIAITVERSVAEQRAVRRKLESDALDVIAKVIEKEPRLALKEKDLSKITKGHPEYQALHGDKGIMGVLKKSGYNLKQIIDFGPQRVLNDVSFAMGWQQDMLKKVEKAGQKKLLQKILEAGKQARTLDLGRKSDHNGRKDSGGYDRESIVTEIASGNFETYGRLLEEAADRGDAKMVRELGLMREEAVKKFKQQHQPGE